MTQDLLERKVEALLVRYCTNSRQDISPTPRRARKERQSLTLDQFDKSLSVTRIGVTYAIEIDFESKYPDLAAQIATTVADVYIELQRTTEYDVARRANDWLEQRIPELRAKSEDAHKAVVEYKNEYNIVETASGRLIDDQRLADMNDKLNAAPRRNISGEGEVRPSFCNKRHRRPRC